MNVMSRHGTSFHAHAANFWCLWWSISSQKSLPKYHPGWIWQMHTNAWRFEDSWPFYPNFFYPNFSNYCGKMVKQTSLSTFQDTHSPLHPTGFTTPPPPPHSGLRPLLSQLGVPTPQNQPCSDACQWPCNAFKQISFVYFCRRLQGAGLSTMSLGYSVCIHTFVYIYIISNVDYLHMICI